MTEPDLFAPVCSIAATRRRRFLWAAWWTAPPERDPFRKPDASNGGARSREEAMREAERIAGRPLVSIEPQWARAWSRVLVGEPPWIDTIDKNAAGERLHGSAPRATSTAGVSTWQILGLTPRATAEEIKRAFRKRALEAHPDHGGDPELFRRLHRAYEEALARSARRAKRPKRT